MSAYKENTLFIEITQDDVGSVNAHIESDLSLINLYHAILGARAHLEKEVSELPPTLQAKFIEMIDCDEIEIEDLGPIREDYIN